MGSDSAILKSWRDELPPCSSSLVKVSELTNNKHESPHFVSGGLNWRMVIYPKGNEEDNESGFVSMYVECLSATPPPMDVFAYLSFFAFNKKDNKYLSIQDVEVKRFNSSRSVWGLSKAVPLDPEKGFLVDGVMEESLELM
ncbi:Ubiquitin C-terminal hydrolase 13 [Cardamine amara subsp. amara]|uniref:Ubiquitin C-terminal hydrolase 13 n=1 Tax=Cardamine amara subsp. amara TaxID=228776 RepID=A0ABD0Z4V3_CARAN